MGPGYLLNKTTTTKNFNFALKKRHPTEEVQRAKDT